MPSMILATNSPHTAPACSLSMWNQTNTTSSEGWNIASPRSSSRKGRRYRKTSIAIFHLSNPYPSKCYKTPEHLFRLSPRQTLFRSCRGCIRRECRNFVARNDSRRRLQHDVNAPNGIFPRKRRIGHHGVGSSDHFSNFLHFSTVFCHFVSRNYGKSHEKAPTRPKKCYWG